MAAPPSRSSSARPLVHVYRVPLDERIVPVDAALLSPDERARAERFHFEADRARFSRVRAELRRVLGAALGRPPTAVELTGGRDEKPRLAGRDGDSLAFSLSRARGLGLIAVGARPLGVDIEAVDAQPFDAALAARILSPDELAALTALPPDERARALLRAWTRKEALLKGTGDGLSVEPATIDARVPPTGWALVDLDLGDAWVGALAIQGEDLPEVVFVDRAPVGPDRTP
jgi:4'-phosphopantetheinyl transferase